MKIFSLVISIRDSDGAPAERGRTTSSLIWLIPAILVIAAFTIMLAFYINDSSQNKPADYTSLITATTSIVLALVTVVTLIENRRISQVTINIANKSLEETRLMRESQTEPMMLVRLQPREEYIGWIDMVVENTGPGAAHDVQFKISPQMDDLMRTKLSEMGFVKRGLSCMASGQKLQFLLTSMAERPDEKATACYTVDVDYKNSIGKSYHNRYTLDFSEMAGLTHLGTPPLYDIAKALKGMKEDINRVSTGWNRMKVIAYSPEDIKKEQEARRARMGAPTQKSIDVDGNEPLQKDTGGGSTPH